MKKYNPFETTSETAKRHFTIVLICISIFLFATLIYLIKNKTN